MHRLHTFLIGILLGAILGAVTIQQIGVKPDKEYVYVDIDKIISAIAQDIGNGSVSKEALPAKLKELKGSFERALTAYQQEHNAIILSSKPIKGATDKTDYFIAQIRNEGSQSVEQQPAKSEASIESTSEPVSSGQLPEDIINNDIADLDPATQSDLDSIPATEIKVESAISENAVQEPIVPKSIPESGEVVPSERTADGTEGNNSSILEPTTQPAAEVSKTVSEPSSGGQIPVDMPPESSTNQNE